MIKFKRCAFLIGQNILNLSQRTLFSEKALFLQNFQKKVPKYGIKTDNNCQIVNPIKNLSIPSLLKINLVTQVAIKNDEHIEVFRQRLIRIYGDSIQKPEELTQLGPVTMQLFHQLDWPEKALEFYYEFNNQYFDSTRTALILMDLLFESKRYNDILKVYRIRSTERKRTPSSSLRTCAYAACYKLNTHESLQYAINLQNECESDIDKNRRIDFVAMLAFNQKKYDLALSLLGDNHYLPANNIKLLTMTELNDWNGANNLLHKIETNGPIDKRYRVSREVFQKISQKLDLSKQSLSPFEWETCHSCLHKIQHSSVAVLHPQTMDEILCMPIKTLNHKTKAKE